MFSNSKEQTIKEEMILLTTNARLSRHLGLKEREKKMEIEFKKMTGDIGKIYHEKKTKKTRSLSRMTMTDFYNNV